MAVAMINSTQSAIANAVLVASWLSPAHFLFEWLFVRLFIEMRSKRCLFDNAIRGS